MLLKLRNLFVVVGPHQGAFVEPTIEIEPLVPENNLFRTWEIHELEQLILSQIHGFIHAQLWCCFNQISAQEVQPDEWFAAVFPEQRIRSGIFIFISNVIRGELFPNPLRCPVRIRERSSAEYNNIGIFLFSTFHQTVIHPHVQRIICIYKADVLSGCSIQTSVSGMCRASVFLVDDSHTVIGLGNVLQNRQGIIGRTIIDANDFQVPILLVQNGMQGVFQILFCIVNRHDDGNQRKRIFLCIFNAKIRIALSFLGGNRQLHFFGIFCKDLCQRL